MKRIITSLAVVLLATGLASGKDLAFYKATYDNEMEVIVLSHGMQMSSSAKQYTDSLRMLLSQVKKAGDLAQYDAVDAEIRRFQRDRAMPDTPSAVTAIQTLQTRYTEQATRHTAEKDKKVTTLTQQYDKALGRLQKKLVASGNIDEARALQEERTRAMAATHRLATKPHQMHQEKGAIPAEPATPSTEELEGLVLWYSFDKKSSKATDKSKYRNHGRVVNIDFAEEGKQGGAFRFKGGNSYVCVPNNESLAMKEAFTIMAWVRFEVVQEKEEHYIVSRNNWYNKTGYGLTTLRSGDLRCIFSGMAGQFKAQGVIQNGNWAHIASIYDGKQVSCVVNGGVVKIQERQDLRNEDSDLYIGCPSSVVGDAKYSMLGEIDEVMVFNRALTLDELDRILTLQD
ncbi:MAG: LamG domain-containing protein [Verrucomicrobia bacterium]|jgi:hypothetical protein|nr:LamG domain-containing protein [Verrucomicrobiota bacterium]